jgi:uncharacterized cupredoxin-like copper-binding protein
MRTIATLTLPVALLVALAGCGGDDDTSALSGTTETTGGEDMDMGHDDDHGSFAFGEPAEAGEADRTIEVTMSDDFTYDPDSIAVSAGDTVTFEVTNSGKIVHEFVLGDEALQHDHEEEMQEMEGEMMMEDEPNGIGVEPGDTKSLTFHFTEPAEIEYACHQPGHYDAGMSGPLTVS